MAGILVGASQPPVQPRKKTNEMNLVAIIQSDDGYLHSTLANQAGDGKCRGQGGIPNFRVSKV